MADTRELHIAEIPYDDGAIKFRFSRYMSDDGTKWIRHGLFETYYPSGQISAEGNYENDTETGMWKEYHENGLLAAQGSYINGVESNDWKYWDIEGKQE